MPPALGSKVSQDLAAALLATFVYTSFALSCFRIFTRAVPSTLFHFLMWDILICILVSTPETSEDFLIFPAEVIVLSYELREYLACSAVYFWVCFHDQLPSKLGSSQGQSLHLLKLPSWTALPDTDRAGAQQMLVEATSDLDLYLGISAGTLSRQVLLVYGQLDPGIWDRILGLSLISQAGQPKRVRLESWNQPAKPMIFTRLTVSRPKQPQDRE